MPGERGLPGSRRGRINLRAAPLHQRNVNKAPRPPAPKIPALLLNLNLPVAGPSCRTRFSTNVHRVQALSRRLAPSSGSGYLQSPPNAQLCLVWDSILNCPRISVSSMKLMAPEVVAPILLLAL